MSILGDTTAAIDECALGGWEDTTLLGDVLGAALCDGAHTEYRHPGQQIAAASLVLDELLPRWDKLSLQTRAQTVLANRLDLIKLFSGEKADVLFGLSPGLTGPRYALHIQTQAWVGSNGDVPIHTTRAVLVLATRTNVSRRP